MSKQKRVAVFFHRETYAPGYTPIAVGEGRIAYVRGRITPKGTVLCGKRASQKDGFTYASKWGGQDENFMNGHYVSVKENT
jgi:hypothetical protein